MSLQKHITNWILSRKNNSSDSKQFLNWSQLKKIIVFCHENQLSHIVDFINLCQKNQIETLVAIVYNGKIEQAPKPNFNHVILNKKHFSFWEIPHPEIINQLSSFSADIIINIGNDEQFKTLAMSKLVKAKCKIGSFENAIYDIAIAVEKTTSASNFLQQVVVYLQMIKTKNT
jgi:hypothetical protein